MTHHHPLNNISSSKTPGPILYWMDRDRRTHDNWALLHAQKIALEQKQSLLVCYILPKTFLDSSWRHHDFMIKGLKETEKELAKQNIPFAAFLGNHEEKIPELIKKHKIATLVRDFSPLNIISKWNTKIVQNIHIPFIEVDARNIIPAWTTSDKEEYAARTIRPKIHKLLPKYLVEFPKLKKHPYSYNNFKGDSWDFISKNLEVNRRIKPVDTFIPGEKAAKKVLDEFISKKISQNYKENRNDPNKNVLSNLSPYLHFGHISAARIALEVQKHTKDDENQEAFLEELIVRRELADNFCLYNKNYDNFSGFKPWAQKTLNDHRNDKREYTYSLKEFEEAKTHEPLWNAAQNEMRQTGKMHGYMRMYWAKKILEWTKTPEEAIKIAIYLNDAYSLDGRDSNGYTGIAWSIGGIHDRAWFERPIFGKIRYMNANGARRKFNTEKYIQNFTE